MDKHGIELRTTPHIHAVNDVVVIMRNVVFASLPMAAWSVWLYGLSALLLMITVVVSCLLTERLFNLKVGNTLGDWSATITGILLFLTLPPSFPLWMGAVAGFIAIGLGKTLFGGLGMNVFNPALVGRAFVQAAFPVAITSWTPALFDGRFSHLIPSTMTIPFLIPAETAQWNSQVAVDTFTGATPLALKKFDAVNTPVMDLFTGMTSGSAGESSAIIILVCGLYLAFRHMLDWRIPLSVMAGTWLTAEIFFYMDPATYPDGMFMLLSGGLMLGAWFMATDMVGSPVTAKGVVIYGLLIGFITVMIRLFGGLTEGVMYAILLCNAATPLIDQITQSKVFGEKSSLKSSQS